MALSQAQIEQFKIDGYLVLPGFLAESQTDTLTKLTQHHLKHRISPFELEAEVRYPGSPKSQTDTGGDTIRRLLLADRRADDFFQLANQPMIVRSIGQILQTSEVYLNPNHHNCVMTKQPKFSSDTLWHRDTRYWNFNNKYLINAWFALGDELAANGAMKILPGSHRWQVQDEALDKDQFLLLNHPYNKVRLETARSVELSAGDALLFSAHCFHAAGRNKTQKPKLSAVFTYHGPATSAITGTRSAKLPTIRVGV